MDFFEELQWRGLVYDATEGAREALARGPVAGYIGFDPTAPSLHVGSLLMILALAHLQRHGHTAIAVVGGGTGLIGDPSGKTSERQLMTIEQVDANAGRMRGQLARFLDFDRQTAPAILVNNAEWLTRLGAIEFMRDIGKHFTVSGLLAKESVKRRIESEEGISYTEFSYSLLQAYDFLVLHDRYGCTLQLGGSDQWGNITAGMDLIRRVRGAHVHGLVLPLVTNASGSKFGKTESGTVWLDAAMTSPYEFYQFWFNVEDREVVRYLKYFTFLDRPAIEALSRAVETEPERRHAQRELAREMTRLVHGMGAVRDAESAAEALFRGDLSAMSVGQLLDVFAKVPASVVEHRPEGWRLAALLSESGVTASVGEAVRLIRQGGLYVNERRVTDEQARITPAEAIEGQLIVVRKGKRDHHLIRIQRG